MTLASETAQVIVVAEQEVYDLLAASGAAWDLQHRVTSVAEMWAGLTSGTLSNQSKALVFSPSLAGENPDLIAQAVAVMAPYAAVFVVAWDPEAAHPFHAKVCEFLVAEKHDPENTPVFYVSPEADYILDTMRSVLADSVAFPEVWPEAVYSVLPSYEEGYEGDGGEQASASAPVYQEAVPEPVYAPTAPVAPVAPAMPARPAMQTSAPAMPVGVASTVSTGAPNILSSPVLDGQVTIAVTSSKGGSGKSTTALMLASMIATASKAAAEAADPNDPNAPKAKKVVLVDMDTRDGQVASLLGQFVPTALNIRVQQVWDEQTVTRNLVHDQRLGIDALLAPVRPRTADDVGPDFYRHIINVLKRTHDVIILDTSVNYLDPLIATVCLPESSAILFVTTLATTAVQGMARALREITEQPENGGMGITRKKIGVVVNQAVAGVGMEPDQVVQAALGVQIVGKIPMATKDVLISTNYNRMWMLLKHPTLGPAYYELASNSCPRIPLSPPDYDKPRDAGGGPAPTGLQGGPTPPAPRQGGAAAPTGPAGPAAPEGDATKGGGRWPGLRRGKA